MQVERTGHEYRPEPILTLDKVYTLPAGEMLKLAQANLV